MPTTSMSSYVGAVTWSALTRIPRHTTAFRRQTVVAVQSEFGDEDAGRALS